MLPAKIDPKIVPSSHISEPQEQSSFEHEYPYCDINGYDIGFNNTDLLERHVIQRPVGCTAYPGPLDLEEERTVYQWLIRSAFKEMIV